MDRIAAGAIVSAVLDFWFGAAGSREIGRPRLAWFRRDAAFDGDIRNRFLSDHELAASGAYDGLAATPQGGWHWS